MTAAEGLGPETALAGFDVSRETSAKLGVLAAELQRWQAVKNLVGPATLTDVWTRHIADSLQLLEHAGTARTWLDLGSGAGFPGLVVAIGGEGRGMTVDLVESNARKCAFLRHVVRLTGAAAGVHQTRFETVIPSFVGKVDVVSARALAPLRDLLAWTEPLLTTGTTGLFPKGRDAAAELTEAEKLWRFDVAILPSRTAPEARILRIAHLESRR
jgi:16S rRNA (guanine527-N7)-methyltransferase